MFTVSRRFLLAGLPVATWVAIRPAVPAGQSQSGSVAGEGPSALASEFPRFDSRIVETFVGVCHRDVAEVTRMVEHQPSLARASWDWGFGDWETGLGAAAHTGRRNIADVVLAHGARPTIFSAAMMGQLDVVRAFVAASPGIQRTPGPHGITLLRHARAGGPDAEPVVKYLESVGGADDGPAVQPLDAADRDALVGRYVYGPGTGAHFDVDVSNDRLRLGHDGNNRFLFHTGDLVFFPSGVPSVKLAFARDGGKVTRLTIADPDVFVTAIRR